MVAAVREAWPQLLFTPSSTYKPMQFYTQKPHDSKQNIVSYITKHTYITANLAIYCAAYPRLPGTAQISSFTFAEMGDSLTFSQPARPFSYFPKSRLAGTLFCGGVSGSRAIEGNAKLKDAFELGKAV